MAEHDELFDYLRSTDTVHIVTTTRDGRTIPTPIWAVAVDDAIYVRSAYGPDAKWYRRATTNGGVAFDTPAGARAVAIEAPNDAGLEARIDDALQEKYAAEPASVAEMLTPLARGTTQRVTPVS
ncbi:DUF2255 family protein [Agromyces albus]|uniref:DUF2255 family protein n=1 Tax=Agromyces albus TaxID=205332 RepID=UPI00278030F0|nr:DUF2255 family protein [Agromyces albus]MDQ0577097.1 hypothetical protein [Agromyces albus]